MPISYAFPRRMRVADARQFERVYEAKVRVSDGALLIYALPNDLPHPRLGLSVSTRVGGAVKRNAIKRRLREAFRLLAPHWPVPQRGYDLVISVRAHQPLKTAAYQLVLESAIQKLHARWIKKLNKQTTNPE
jgi:ribonuclease P protein component